MGGIENIRMEGVCPFASVGKKSGFCWALSAAQAELELSAEANEISIVESASLQDEFAHSRYDKGSESVR